MKTGQQRHSVSEQCLILTLACAVLLGFYIDFYEIDTKPTPRTLFNLAGAYFESGDMEKALKYWRICANYNEIYDTNYPEHTWPSGQRIKICKENLKPFENFENDLLFHRGKK